MQISSPAPPRSARVGVSAPNHLGFSVTELMVVVALIAIIGGMAIPASMRFSEAMRLSAALRAVEREMQTARLKAVSTNKSMRVYFNCPAAGQFRMVEVMGLATVDTASDRCGEMRFPYPSPRDTDMTTPSADGPVRSVEPDIALSPAFPNLTLQFDASGRTFLVSGGIAQAIGVDGVALVVEQRRTAQRRTVNINGLGRIQID